MSVSADPRVALLRCSAERWLAESRDGAPGSAVERRLAREALQILGGPDETGCACRGLLLGPPAYPVTHWTTKCVQHRATAEAVLALIDAAPTPAMEATNGSGTPKPSPAPAALLSEKP
jgi:hypothetical protein